MRGADKHSFGEPLGLGGVHLHHFDSCASCRVLGSSVDCFALVASCVCVVYLGKGSHHIDVRRKGRLHILELR